MVSWLKEWLDVSTTQAKWIITLGLVVVLSVLRWIVLRVVHRRIDDPSFWYRTRKIVSYAVSVVFVLIVARLWIEGGSFGTWIGLITAGVAIALADVLKNLAGWFYIVLRRPFRVGDRIEIQGNVGDVVDIRAFRFSMLEVGNWVHADQSTGRILHIPNGLVFTEPIANYTEGFAYIWHEIPVLVTFESDWALMESIVLEAIERHAIHHDPARAEAMLRRTAQEYQIRYTHLTPAVYVTVKDSGVLVTGRLLVEVRKRRSVEGHVWKDILRRIAEEPTVDLAYPTVRTFLPDRLKIDRPVG